MTHRPVYRAPGEPLPRATASGSENVVEAVSSMHGLGMMAPPRGCPTCDGPVRFPITYAPVRYPIAFNPSSGATARVPQPPPSNGISVIVGHSGVLPISPAPSPTVGVPASQTAPQLTQPGTQLDASGASIQSASGISAWLQESSLISGVPNWTLAAGAAALVFFSMNGGGGRRR